MKYSSNDADKLARTILGEATGETYAGKVAVANTVANRAYQGFSSNGVRNKKNTNSSVADIATNPVQYNAWSPSITAAAYRNTQMKETDPRYQEALSIAKGVLDGSIPDNTAGATHYYNPDKASPAWGPEMARAPNYQGVDHQLFGTVAPGLLSDRNAFEQAANTSVSPNPSMARSEANADQLAARGFTGQAPQTFGDRMRATLGLPTTLGIQAVNGMISLSQLAEAAASNIAQQSAAQQPNNPSAVAPPSNFAARPAGPVSSNQFNPQGSALPGSVAQGPDLSSPLGRMNAAIGRNPNAGVASATPTNDYRDTPQDRMRAAVGAPPAASYQGPGQRGFSPPAASSYSTLGMTAGPTGFSTGGMFSAGPQAMGAAMGSFAKAAPKASPQAYGGPTAAADASNRPQATTMPMGFNPQSTVGMNIGNQLTDPDTIMTHVSPQAAMDEANLSAQIANALSTGYAPGAVSGKKPGEPGYQAPAPSVPKLTPKMPQKQAAPAPVAARPLAPPQSQFAPQTPVYNNLGSIVGAIGQAGKAYTPDFAPNTSVYNQSGQVVGSISGRTTQASPLSSGGLSSLGGFFNNGSAALGSLGGFSSAVGGYNTGTSNAYGNQTYGTRSYGGNGGSTLGGGDNHRAL